MGCSNCSKGNGLPAGCKNNGACGVSGCNKLEVFDWLANMELPAGDKEFDIVEVRFKNSRKGFFKNVNELPLATGDVVAVEANPGHDIGIVSIAGELVRLQMQKKNVSLDNKEIKKVYRKARQDDIDKWKEARSLEEETMIKSRQIAYSLNLNMKISDVEYQGDKTKATFYYTADERVDFRELIKILADEFKVRIEMRQIGARQEASRLGGIGSCGRELCCATWLTDFRSVSTGAARYQQLSLNPQKLAGQCGKLKCCLNYELDSYLDALKDFPKPSTKLKTKAGVAFLIKTDIFKRTLWYVYEDVSGASPMPLPADRVKEIIAANEKGEIPDDLKYYLPVVETREPEYMNVVGQDSLTRFDEKKRKKKKNKKKKPNTGSPERTGPPKKPFSKRTQGSNGKR